MYRPGDSFGQYTLVKFLGGESLSELWLAFDRGQGQQVTLRIALGIPTSEYEYGIERDRRIVEGLDHPCVLRFMSQSGTADNHPFLVFEPVNGRSLREELRESGGRLVDMSRAANVFADILLGLGYIHNKQIVHRNLKPDNVLVPGEGMNAKISDFSFARILSQQSMAEEAGSIVGTIPYMSPEQIRGEPDLDGRTDLYSFGVLLYETLTGRQPFTFDGTGFSEIIKAHLEMEPPSLRAARAEVPEALEFFYRRLLAKNKQERYLTAREAWDDLATIFTVRLLRTIPSRPKESRDSAAEFPPAIVRTPVRICPVCRRTYDTELDYCLQDGSILEAYTNWAQTPGNMDTRREWPVPNDPVPNTLTSFKAEDSGARADVPPAESVVKAFNVNWNNLNTAMVFGEESIAPEPVAPPPPQILSAAPASPPTAARQPLSTLQPGQPFDDLPRVGMPGSVGGARWDAPEAESFGGSDSSVFQVGTVLSGYRIEGYLAQGGFGNVYLAVETEDYFPEKLVLKVPIREEDPDELYRGLRSQFKKWGLLSKTEPERVVRLLGVKRLSLGERVVVGIFMEYMAGGNLLEIAQKDWEGRPRSRNQLAHLMRLFIESCHAVSALHRNELVHRDIKPANILLDTTKTKCKISDFELIASMTNDLTGQEVMGTIPYMAPECFEGEYSTASDIFALGATLYHLLSGSLPFGANASRARHPSLLSIREPPFIEGRTPQGFAARRRKQRPEELTKLNPLVPPELSQVVMRCLEPNPSHRLPSVDDLTEDLIRLGLTGEGANAAPLNLARLLMTHMDEYDRSYLVKSLERSGFRTVRDLAAEQQADLIEEYCYTAPPDEVLAHNCTMRQLTGLAGELGLELKESTSREEIIDEILAAVGFSSGPRQVPGIETTRGFLDGLLLNLSNATTTDECIGMAHSGVAAIERTVDLLVSFYGQLLYGSGLNSFLTRHAQGKSSDMLTLGQKINALEELCGLKRPRIPLSERVRQVFEWPIIKEDVFALIKKLKDYRNELAHRADFGGFHAAQRFARQAITIAVEAITELDANRYAPRVVQVISRQDDVYGRHFYLGQDDRGRSERIFTPLPLEVGQLYLFFPLTNPARINPLIFPYGKRKR